MASAPSRRHSPTNSPPRSALVRVVVAVVFVGVAGATRGGGTSGEDHAPQAAIAREGRTHQTHRALHLDQMIFAQQVFLHANAGEVLADLLILPINLLELGDARRQL